MLYNLMHRNVLVCEIDIDLYGKIKKITKMYDESHMPVGTLKDISKTGVSKLNDWFINRTIPISRYNFKEIIKNNNITTPTELPLKSYALSLSDQYWIKKTNEVVLWDDINFFDNAFSLDLGDLLVGKKPLNEPFNFISPDSSSNGDLMKRWKIINGKRILLKSGTKPYNYEVFNELIASKIMDRLDINHVRYYFLEDDNKVYSASENFITSSKELVTIYQLFNDYKKSNNESYFDFLMNILSNFNITNYKEEINKMLFIDFLIGNVDRHLNNFGVIRDIKTLEIEAIAPIYDSGSSFGFNLNDTELEYAFELDWKPFKSGKIRNQLDLIDDFSWLDMYKLNKTEDDLMDICIKYSNYISPIRRDALLKFLRKRIDYINNYLNVVIRYPGLYSKLDLKILDYIKNNDIIDSIDSLIPVFNKSHITIQRSLNKLVKDKRIERIGANKNGYWKYKG